MPAPQGGILIDPNKPQQQSPSLPPMRTFIVRRYHPEHPYDNKALQEIQVQAHTIQHDAERLIFVTGWFEDGEVRTGITRMFNGWLDVEEAEIRYTAPTAH
jgi:hypothetical protein